MRTLLYKCTALLLCCFLTVQITAPALAAEVRAEEVRAAEETLSSAEALREPLVQVDKAQTVTVMVYMIASDLESERGLAYADLEEMMNARYGENVQVVIQTMGCKRWSTDQVRSDTSQRFTIQNGKLVLQEDELGQLDSTDPQTLQDFLTWCGEKYPADRNILVLWDHGSGPVYGYGCDQYQPQGASLTLDELQSALGGSGLVFDLIGFDACLMGALETGCVLYDYGDYMLASEDFETGRGWDYTALLNALGQAANCPTQDLGRKVVKAYVRSCDAEGNDGVLSLIDLRYMKLLYRAWEEFAYANEETLTKLNYSRETEGTSRSASNSTTYSMTDYYVTDLMGVAATIESQESEALRSALACAVVEHGATEGDKAMTGLSVSLPYGDRAFFWEMEQIFQRCGFAQDYLDYLQRFVTAEGSEDYYEDWDDFDESWNDWSDYDSVFSAEDWEQWLEEYGEDWEEGFGWDRYLWLEDVGIYIAAVPAYLAAGEEVQGDWSYDRRANLYYYVFSDGSVEYYNPVINSQFYEDAATGRWYIWRVTRGDWFQCPNMGYEIAGLHAG